MRIIILICFLFSLTNLKASFNTKKEKDKKVFSISGKVSDHLESLMGVKVMLDHKEVSVYTDFEGNFTIDNVPEGQHVVSFSLIAYGDKKIVVSSENIKKLEVRLEAK